MDAKERKIKLKRILLDIEELYDACWSITDKEQLEKVIDLLEEVDLESYDD